ncbi:uncharacterized protein LOC134442280 [Engraulis encrasicolus]|uniref:uncharacterized protein LOC134442280 n=1 Tax=Engraulis encrasicolus TaxID=184585 RepID=UPI002FD184AE
MGRRNKKSQAAKRRYIPLDLHGEGQLLPKAQKSLADVEMPPLKRHCMTRNKGGTLQPVRTIVETNRALFEKEAELLKLAEQEMNDELLQDAWCQLCPQQEEERLECKQNLQNVSMDDEEWEEIPDLADLDGNGFVLEKDSKSLSKPEAMALIRSLNETQLAIFYQIRQWCLDKRLGNNPEPFHVFITGGAGVGKSHLIKAIHCEASRLLRTDSGRPDDILILLTAPTGIAAYNLQASTIHSALAIGTAIKLPYTPLGEEKLNSLRSQLGNLQILVIDEISMVNQTLLAYVHGRLRQIKQTGDFAPFGNLSIIACGDLFQLSPVRGKPLYMDADGVDLWKTYFSVVELTTVVRQKDTTFAELLNRLRIKSKTTPLSASDVRLLRQRETGEESTALHIFPTNEQVQAHNMQGLRSSCDEIISIKSKDYKKEQKTGRVVLLKGQHSRVHNSSLCSELCLGIGARVILIKNIDLSDNLVNGVCGSVTHIVQKDATSLPTMVYVLFDDPKVGLQRRKQQPCPNVHLTNSTPICPVEERIDYKGGMRRQIPLKLAYALTIHKVQGLTLDQAVVSLGKVFAPGQAYVALSRVKSLPGLIIQQFSEKAIYCKEDIQQAINEMPKFLCNATHFGKCSDTFTIWLMNIQGLRNHLEDLKCCVERSLPNCVAVTETWLPETVSVQQVQIHGYEFHSSPRGLSYSSQNKDLCEMRTQQHGGVGWYIQCDQKYKMHTISDPNVECSISHFLDKNVIIAAVYRPPKYALKLFMQNLNKIIEYLSSVTSNIIFMGDFNENIFKTKSLLTYMAQRGFQQIVSNATTDTGSLLDHIYVKTHLANCVSASIMPLYFSDHQGIVCSLNM